MLGRRFADLPNPGLEVGVLLDASAQHAGRTGREILTLAQPHDGPGPPAGSTRCSSWSASPKRRRAGAYATTRSGCGSASGIAHALLGDPEVLILDEPANGLDPAGIRWMRDLLRGYADRGGTVLLSSHLLHEIEVVADDLVVIGSGRIVAARHQAASSSPGAGTQVADPPTPDRLVDALTRASVTVTSRHADDADAGRWHRPCCGSTPTPRAWATSRTTPGSPSSSSATADGAGLEEMFLELTADTQRDHHRPPQPRQGAAA